MNLKLARQIAPIVRVLAHPQVEAIDVREHVAVFQHAMFRVPVGVMHFRNESRKGVFLVLL